MGFILESLYLFLIVACIVYYVVLVQNSKNGWEIIEIEDKDLPLVSIIVPTLEEEQNIENCLESLLKLDYPRKEIIVSDGGSQDRTVEIAKKFPVKIIVDSQLPKGWIGKSYGCQIAFKEAKGSILLFTDADTHHTPQSLRTSVTHLIATESDLFSLFPYQKAKRWYEYLLSFFYFLSFLGGGPINNINNPYAKNSVMASGQYMLFTRNSYNKIGGHAAVSKSLVEDLALARLCKEKEMKLNFKDSTKLISTRMYPDRFSDFFEGFRKNIYEGFWLLSKFRIMFIIFWLIYMVVAPYFLIRYLLIRDNWLWWNYTIGIVFNILLYLLYGFILFIYWRKRGRWNFFIFLFYPLTMLTNLIIILVSFYYGFRGIKFSWKNRYYDSEKNPSKEIH
jgi:glycosyltransferase involved in cell wall biosynthesis